MVVSLLQKLEGRVSTDEDLKLSDLLRYYDRNCQAALVSTRLLPIMLKNLPIILFYYSAANWYYSKKTRPLFQQFCKVFTHYSSNFPDQHIHSKETSHYAYAVMSPHVPHAISN